MNRKIGALALTALCATLALAGEKNDALPPGFPKIKEIQNLWTRRVPGLAASFQVKAPVRVDSASPEGKAVLAAFNILQRRKIDGPWRVGRRLLSATKDIKPSDPKGQTNAVSSFAVCYVVREQGGYRLAEAVEVWRWGKAPRFGRARLLSRFD